MIPYYFSSSLIILLEYCNSKFQIQAELSQLHEKLFQKSLISLFMVYATHITCLVPPQKQSIIALWRWQHNRNCWPKIAYIIYISRISWINFM